MYTNLALRDQRAVSWEYSVCRHRRSCSIFVVVVIVGSWEQCSQPAGSVDSLRPDHPDTGSRLPRLTLAS